MLTNTSTVSQLLTKNGYFQIPSSYLLCSGFEFTVRGLKIYTLKS